MICDVFMNERRQLYTDISNVLSHQTWNLFEHLSLLIQFYITMGIKYPMTNDELINIRCASAYHVNKMYHLRACHN